MGKTPKSDTVPAILLIVFSIILYWIIIPDQIHVPSQVKSAFLSPAFAPKAFTLFLGLMALVLLLVTLVRLRTGPPTPIVKRVNKKGILREEGWYAPESFQISGLGALSPQHSVFSPRHSVHSPIKKVAGYGAYSSIDY